MPAAADLALAVRCSLACQASYSGDSEELGAVTGALPEHVTIIPEGDWLAAVCPTDAETLVVLKGTNTLGGWLLTDFDAKLAAAAHWPGRIHKGFLAAYRALAARVARHCSPGVPVLFTGHSAGGPQAVLAAYDLRHIRPVRAVTFGSPRFADAEAAAVFDELEHDRWTHDIDPIPDTPPAWTGYRHSGRDLRVYDDGAVVEGPSAWRRVKGAWSHLRHGPGQLLIDAAAGHHIDRYVQAFQAALAAAPAKAA
jgi:acetyl esterase/lipase